MNKYETGQIKQQIKNERNPPTLFLKAQAVKQKTKRKGKRYSSIAPIMRPK